MLALRKGTWAALRIPFLTILVFTIVTLVATLLHLDRLHFGSDVPLARYAAYFWMGVYVLVPPAMVAVLVVQERRPRRADRAAHADRRWRSTLLAQGAVMLGVGVALFVVPASATVLWPWPLTPLTARVVAAWLLAFGLCADPGRAEPGPGPARRRGLGVRAAGAAGDRGRSSGIPETVRVVDAGDLGLPRPGRVDPGQLGVRAGPAAPTRPRERLGPGEPAADTVIQ